MGLSVIFLTALLALPASAETVYKCTDAEGNMVFSQRPCADDAESVEIGETNSSAPPSAEMSSVLRQRELERKLEDINRRSSSSSYDASSSTVCTGARNRVMSAQERWTSLKRQGYTPDQQRYYEQLIRDRKRHADNMCK